MPSNSGPESKQIILHHMNQDVQIVPTPFAIQLHDCKQMRQQTGQAYAHTCRPTARPSNTECTHRPQNSSSGAIQKSHSMRAGAGS